MIEVMHLTEEDFLSTVDSNNVKTTEYEIIVRSCIESVFENFQSFFRTMNLKNDDLRCFSREHS